VAHDPTDDFIAIAYIVIVITAATALVIANKSKGGCQSCLSNRRARHSDALRNGDGYFWYLNKPSTTSRRRVVVLDYGPIGNGDRNLYDFRTTLMRKEAD